MLNVHDLERRWLKYKIKSYLPLVFSLFGFLIIAIILFIYLPKGNDVLEKKDINLSLKEEILVAKKSIPTVPVKAIPLPEATAIEVPQNTMTKPTENSSSLTLTPSLHFMDNIEDGLNPYVDEHKNLQQLNTPSVSYNQNYTDATETSSSIEVEKPTIKKKSTLTITKNKDESDLKDVIRRFKQNKNPALSLFIAKRYYELEQYQNSYNYALMTNEIDKNIDDSWIIFAKSLVKLGQHELAVLTLKSYLKTTKSTQADILLRKIEAGDFK